VRSQRAVRHSQQTDVADDAPTSAPPSTHGRLDAALPSGGATSDSRSPSVGRMPEVTDDGAVDVPSPVACSRARGRATTTTAPLQLSARPSAAGGATAAPGAARLPPRQPASRAGAGGELRRDSSPGPRARRRGASLAPIGGGAHAIELHVEPAVVALRHPTRPGEHRRDEAGQPSPISPSARPWSLSARTPR
jgi:hypothetical protein